MELGEDGGTDWVCCDDAQETDTTTRSARLREQWDHPVVDGDGHIVQLMAVFLEGTLNPRRAASVLGN